MCVEEIWVPGPKVGMVIGKGGETIKRLQVRKKERKKEILVGISLCLFS